jgi:hypothetical protein
MLSSPLGDPSRSRKETQEEERKKEKKNKLMGPTRGEGAFGIWRTFRIGCLKLKFGRPCKIETYLEV